MISHLENEEGIFTIETPASAYTLNVTIPTPFFHVYIALNESDLTQTDFFFI